MKNKRCFRCLCVFLLMGIISVHAQDNEDFEKYRQECDRQVEDILWAQYQEVSDWFDAAYQEYPSVPRGMLEAVAFQYTRFSPNVVLDTLDVHPDEMPRVYSIMGLTLQGKGVFRENARMLARMTPYSLDEILWMPGAAVKAYACAFGQLQQRYGIFTDRVEPYRRIFEDLCELPVRNGDSGDFAMNSFLYMVYWFLDRDEHARYGVPKRDVDFRELFGAEYDRLRSGSVSVSLKANPPVRSSSEQADYPGATYVPAASCNYTSGRGGATISSITVHYTQGTYAGAIAWFQNCSAKASAHYVIRSVDGQVTQMVREADKAWHVGVANSYTIGIEHEAYGNIYSYFTTSMYQSSANLVKNICARRGNINPHRVFYRDTLDNGTVLNYGVHSLGGATACTQIRGHQHYPSQTHTDPGQYWNWNLYYKLINDNPTVTVSHAESGTFTDSGGASGDYGNDERKLFLIDVPGAENITLTFQQFALEPDYDFMWVYDGGSVHSPLIGRWNTHSPGQVVSSGSKMLVEFRSDCATTASGWTAQWLANGQGQTSEDGDDDVGDDTDDDWDSDVVNDWEPDSQEPSTDNASPLTVINVDAETWITGDFTASFSDSDDKGIKWRFYQIMESTGSTWMSRHGQGFLCDNFDNSLDVGTWVNNASSPWSVQAGALCQANPDADYAGVAARHNGASHVAYLYDFYLKFQSGERCSFFFNCGNAPSLTSLFSGYEVCFDKANRTVSVYRLILGAKRLLKTKKQVFFQDGTSYLCRVVYDSSTGEIVVMRHGNRLIRAVDQTLATTPHSYVGFVTYRSSVCVDNLRVYGSRASSVAISVGPADTCNVQCQAVNGLARTKLKSIVVDRAYKFSALSEKSIRVDYTPPTPVANVVLQQNAASLPNGTQQITLSAAWDQAADGQSGIKRYYCWDYPCSHCQWSSLWHDNGLSTVCNNCYSFLPNQIVALSVVVENNAGLRSEPVTKILSAADASHSKKSSNNLFSWSVLPGKRLTIKRQHPDETFPDKVQPPYSVYMLYDLSGRTLREGTIADEVTVSLADLSKGVYLLRLMEDDTVLSTEKIVLSN